MAADRLFHSSRLFRAACMDFFNSRRLIMALNKVEICGVNTSRLPVLTNEEKDALFVRIRQGDESAGSFLSKETYGSF